MDLGELDRLWDRHPAWRLLRATNAPLVLSFLGDHFIEHNRGATAAGELAAALDDALFAIRRAEPDRYPASPLTYLDDWSAQERGWLRRFYPSGSDEVHYEATPALEKAYRWVEGLRTRAFVGAESRLHTLMELMRQMVHGSETDPAVRVAELERRRDEIDRQLHEARAGRFAVLDDTAGRERCLQLETTAREVLSDFRKFEEDFGVQGRWTHRPPDPRLLPTLGARRGPGRRASGALRIEGRARSRRTLHVDRASSGCGTHTKCGSVDSVLLIG